MTDLQLPAFTGAQLVTFVLVLARVGGLFVFAPVFSSRMIPGRVKLIVAGSLAFVLAPVAGHGVDASLDPGLLTMLIAKEAAIGLAIAFSIGILTAAVQAGASLVDTLVGFSFASLVDPFTNVQTSVFGQLYGLVATMVLLLSGGDRVMIEGLAGSYEVVPLDAFPKISTLTALATHGFADMFGIALALVAPAVIALLVADAALGLVARAVPQMNVFAVGLPAKIIVALGVVGASLPFVSTQLRTDLLENVSGALRILGG